jgi:hypothetical protein
MDTGRLSRRTVAVGLSLAATMALSACPTTTSSAAPPPVEPTRPPPLPTDDCDLDAAPIPFLPRASNDEIRQLTGDLLGAPVDPALFVRWTPLAQVRGFDTMTEARIDQQTLEEQLRTMESVAAALVQSPSVMASCPAPVEVTPACALHDSYDATAQFSGEAGRDCWSSFDGAGGALVFNAGDQRWESPTDPGLFSWNTGMHPGIGVDVMRRFTVAVDGAVHLQGSFADADPGGGDGVVVEVRGPAGLLFEDVIANGGAPVSFDVVVNARRGEAIDLVVHRNADNAYDTTALSASLTLAPAPAADGLTWDSCGAAVLDHVASRAWRRPLRAEERADLKTVFDEVSASAVVEGAAAPFFSGLEATLQAALLSPNVQYKPELVPNGFAPDEEQFRLASRLSLFFRSSFPDDALRALAEQGALDGEDALRAQADRLLAEQGDRFVDNFGGQWLDFRAPIGADDDALTVASRDEAHDVFAALLAEQAPPQKLIAPGFTIVDETLATHYGLQLPGPGPQRVVTDERGGIFTQAHFLRKTATGSDFKRVIHRGIYTLNRALCTTVPELDPATREEIAASFATIDPTLPLAQRMELHRTSSERCQDCHGMMDPIGLSLERYDEQGRARDTYADGSAIHNDYEYFGTPLEDPEALMGFVGGSDDFHRCVAEKLFVFGLHRAPRPEEACVVDAIKDSADDPRSLHDIAIDAFLESLRLTETP